MISIPGWYIWILELELNWWNRCEIISDNHTVIIWEHSSFIPVYASPLYLSVFFSFSFFLNESKFIKVNLSIDWLIRVYDHDFLKSWKKIFKYNCRTRNRCNDNYEPMRINDFRSDRFDFEYWEKQWDYRKRFSWKYSLSHSIIEGPLDIHVNNNWMILLMPFSIRTFINSHGCDNFCIP